MLVWFILLLIMYSFDSISFSIRTFSNFKSLFNMRN